jgi:hypothetical protein
MRLRLRRRQKYGATRVTLDGRDDVAEERHGARPVRAGAFAAEAVLLSARRPHADLHGDGVEKRAPARGAVRGDESGTRCEFV